ncbi:hypothetical protein ACWA5Z_10260 [Testudinibacter sp. P80/BLE/0925]|uniref:hypothetical protein n=1 Tax=Testudinibacter sp. TW-1 TaxID=3417757 RepID=UPI003D369690
MQGTQAKVQPKQTTVQEKILSVFEQSLTEEQRFLQEVMTGKIKLTPHDEVMEKLEFVLKNGLQRK